MPQQIEYSVVIPLYNEEESLPVLQEELHAAMESLGRGYEIIYVNDGSADSSLEALSALKERYPKIRIISLLKNKGQCKALAAGFRASLGEWIITMDADLQNPPSEICKLLEFKDEYDLIIGRRKIRKDSYSKIAASRLAWFIRLLVLRDTCKDAGAALRIYRRSMIGRIPLFRRFYYYFPYLARTRGFKVKEIDVEHRHRRFGRSKYGNLKRAAEGVVDLWKVRRIVKKAGRLPAWSQ
ncbi:MAG: glycosyltransferase family 2 protein [Candidatus Omnitrophica bacterium]|nr:glycosyltransferase family 2 protein [Candidatus Omnitrophota bacterium]